MRIILHICCAPCSTYTIRCLREEGHELRGFFYNPNIHPFSEYLRRRASLEEYARWLGLEMIWGPEDHLQSFLRQVAFHEEDRCRICYRMRLQPAAETALAQGYSAFSTTLLISPYQKHSLLREVGADIAEETGVEFYYRDLRSGWRSSREEARRLDLYLQSYCGCLYSEKERIQEKMRKKGCLPTSTPSAKS